MANLKNYMTEITLSVISFMWLWFVLTNANINLGNAYLWAIAISFILLIVNVLIFDKQVRVTYQKNPGGHLEAFFAGTIGWVLVLISSFLIMKFVEPSNATFYSIIKSFGAANPAFSASKIVNWLTVSFAIGYGETQLFARLLEFISDKLNIPINRQNIMRAKFIITSIILAIVFAIFHATAKGVQATASLILVGIMMMISLIMIAYFNGETRQAVWLHVISNGAAGLLLLSQGGTLFG